MLSRFPDPRLSDEEYGVLCQGGDLEVETLIDAYSHGIFPWPHEDYPLLWFSPKERGVLKKIRYPRSFKRWRKKQNFTFTRNKAFEEVIDYCAKVPRKDQSGTWIDAEMKSAFMNFHMDGYVHSIEGWVDGKLCCGLYGVYVGGVFSAESMFGLVDNSSKLALCKTYEWLKVQGLSWIDVQMVTPVTESFGAQLVPQDEFLSELSKAKKAHPKKLTDDGLD